MGHLFILTILHSEGYGHIRTKHIYNAGKTLCMGIKALIRAFTIIEKQTTINAKYCGVR